MANNPKDLASERESMIQNLLALGSGKEEWEIVQLLERNKWDAEVAADLLFDIELTPSTPPNPGLRALSPALGLNGTISWEGGRWPSNDVDLGWSGGADIGPQQSNSSSQQRGRSMERGGGGRSGILNASSSSLTTVTPEPAVIDLTMDENDELSKAVQLSLDDTVKEIPTFGPSERAPSVHWAMVPSNVAVPPSTEDQEMNRAVQASLDEFMQEDIYVDPPLIDQIRQGGRPMALRAPYAGECWAALLIPALYHIPQVRKRLAALRTQRPPDDSGDPFSELNTVILLQQFFCLLQLGQMSFHTLPPDHFRLEKASPTRAADGLTDDFLTRMAKALESCLAEFRQGEDNRLFYFRLAPVESTAELQVLGPNVDKCIVNIDVDPSDTNNADLISHLTSEHLLLEPHRRRFIYAHSDVVAISLRRRDFHPAEDKWEPFKYPPTFFLDRFLAKSAEISMQKIDQQMGMKEEIAKFQAERDDLTILDGKDVLHALRSSLYYIAEICDDPALAEKNAIAKVRLPEIIAEVERRVEAIDKSIAKLRADSLGIFDTPDLQNHRYDLRAVLYQDGLLGRDHIYSYVKDYETDVWWKILDHTVTEVTEETVLTDSTGIQIGGGPYLLLYSVAIDATHPDNIVSKSSWPDSLQTDVAQENESFREGLPDDMARELEELEAEHPPESQMDIDGESQQGAMDESESTPTALL